MTHEIHCSACDTLIEPENKFCPGCGLQLMAQPTPAVYVEGPRFSLLQIVVLAIGAFVLLCYIADALKR